MSAPQIIVLAVLFLDWCGEALLHEKPRKGRHDVSIATMNVLAVLVPVSYTHLTLPTNREV